MSKKPIVGALSTCSLLLLSQGALAALAYDQNVTSNAIFGSGNINGSWTTDTQNNVELGLRGKLRHNLATGLPENTFNSNGDGTYTFDAGVPATQSFPTGTWSFEWSINVDQDGTSGRNLDDLTYQLWIDNDSDWTTSYTIFDVINDANPGTGDGHWDHSMGDNSTAQGAGSEASDIATYSGFLSTFNLAQNSWKATWFIAGYDPTVDGRYDFVLKAFDGATELASTNMTIIQGAGVVPLPASVWLFRLGSRPARLGSPPHQQGRLNSRRHAARHKQQHNFWGNSCQQDAH